MTRSSDRWLNLASPYFIYSLSVTVIIWRGRRALLSFFSEKEAGRFQRWNPPVGAKCPGEEVAQIGRGAGVGNSQIAFWYPINCLDGAENTAEVVVIVVDVALRCISGNHHQ